MTGPDPNSGEVGRVVTPGYGNGGSKRRDEHPMPTRVEKPAPKTSPAPTPKTHPK